jgi:peptide/nickel transport system ATP-binding protein
MRYFRWRKIAMIFQAAMNALNPVQRVDAQIAEAIMTHDPGSTKEGALAKVADLFGVVGIPVKRMHEFPHQYSGGMKQRAVIAMALACHPSLIIADEPTTALDVIVQDQILQAIRKLQREMNLGIVFISHDIAVVADLCHDIAVMYEGRIVELGRREEVFGVPAHPYTRLLLASHLTLEHDRSQPVPDAQTACPGELQDGGCPFCDLCPESQPACASETLQWRSLSETHGVLCRQRAGA